MAGAQRRPVAAVSDPGPVLGEGPGPGSSNVAPAGPAISVVAVEPTRPADRSARLILEAAETEDGFLGWVRELADVRRWRVYHTLRSKGSPAGFPDLVLLRPPRLIFAELKTATGRVSPAQRGWLIELENVAAGAGIEGVLEVYVWRPGDRAEIEQILA